MTQAEPIVYVQQRTTVRTAPSTQASFMGNVDFSYLINLDDLLAKACLNP